MLKFVSGLQVKYLKFSDWFLEFISGFWLFAVTICVKMGIQLALPAAKKFHINVLPALCLLAIIVAGPLKSFIGSSRQLYQHFSSKHKGSATHFQYNNTFPVFFTLNDKSHILQEEKGVVFILNNRAEILGNLITISCIAPSSSNGGCYYEIAAKMEGSNIRFQSFTKNIQKVNDDDPHADDFLVIPNSFFGSYGQISLDVGIWRYGAYPACIQKRTSANSQRTTSTNMQSSTDANVQSSTET
ncbi:hypothetical protein GH714_032697 [Hevea brasiliensis]|uniref:Uncharacterized protein n=1 Tax=Hevea brasiliensis TaxID=3981 RepID=A0A6A6L355_HEVBR|nr:hypothetical protein GH714_032697 [Hevea brasiliensis]